MYKASYHSHILQFNYPGGTSRGVLTEKPSWYIKIWHKNNLNVVGTGEISLIPNLSPEQPEFIKQYLYSFAQNPDVLIAQFDKLKHPAIKFAIETALIDLSNGGNKILFPSDFTKGKKGIQINGLIWMGKKAEMLERIKVKVSQGFNCIKIKVGAISFEEELNLLSYIRNEFSRSELEIRVDANGAFTANNALQKIEALSKFHIHSIEQPITQGQFEQMAELCQQTAIPIALDEELIGVHDLTYKKQLLEYIKPQFIILKPSLIGGLSETNEWAQLAESLNIGWWVTSALEGNIGLNAIAQWTYVNGSEMPQGLGTGQVFSNNVVSPLKIKGQELWYNTKTEWSNVYSPPLSSQKNESGTNGIDVKTQAQQDLIKINKNTTVNKLANSKANRSLKEMPIKQEWKYNGYCIVINHKTYDLKEINWHEFKNTCNEDWWHKIVAVLEEWCNNNDAIILQTSGTTGEPKYFKVEKSKFWISAAKTCEYFNLTKKSNALLCLSADYIAGKMMLVRALVSGMNLICVEPSNQPLNNINTSIDFTAMVPMQVRENLHHHNFNKIKNIIIGGGFVDEELGKQLKNLKPRAYETFGMTETLSHIALKQIAPVPNGCFIPLPGISVSQGNDDILVIDYPEMGIYKMRTNDRVKILNINGHFKWIGRNDFIINSGGIKISPEQIEKEIGNLIKTRFCVVGKPDEKLGEKVVLVIEGNKFNTNTLFEKLRKSLPSYFIPKSIEFIHHFPTTNSGKIQRKKIFET